MDRMSRDKKLLNEPEANPVSTNDLSKDVSTIGNAKVNRRSTASSRYERYSVILDTIVAKHPVEIDSVKSLHPSEQPAFITRTINQLVTDGWLVREVEHGAYVWNQSRGNFDSKKWLDQKIFGVQIKAAPFQDRPRERLLEIGKENLTIAELVAILIRSGRPGGVRGDRGTKSCERISRQAGSLSVGWPWRTKIDQFSNRKNGLLSNHGWY